VPWGHLVDQVAALHLETLGVPVRWESWPDDQPKSFREELMFHAADVAGAAVLGLTRQITDLMAVASVDQAEEYDQSALNLTGGKLDRLMEYRIKPRGTPSWCVSSAKFTMTALRSR